MTSQPHDPSVTPPPVDPPAGESAPADAPLADARATGGQAHDPDYPERLLAFMRTGWNDTTLAITPSPGGAELRGATGGRVRGVRRPDGDRAVGSREGAGERHDLSVPSR